jgi:hypothetical protein
MGEPPSGGTQVAQVGPHAVTDVSGAQAPLHLLKPIAHVTSHWPMVHAAAPLAVPGQGVQRLPQDSGAESDTQAFPQRWKPALQAKSQSCIGVHTGLPLAGAGHAVQRVPQDEGASSGTH